MDRIQQSINMIDTITKRLDDNKEMSEELEREKREEARIENAEYKDECREEKIDW